MYRLYKVGISYFALFSVLLLMTGLVMFYLKTGVSLEGTLEYYRVKSYDGLLELSYPHLGGMGIFIMVLGHFFLFTSLRYKARWWFITMFVAALSSLMAPLFIVVFKSAFFTWIKLLSVVILVMLGVGFSLRLFKESVL
ncbi:MAG: hypothetical protein U9P71_01965 [Campylobacterota bacterium]|nr:hypothetical protein [Campylobacterota bacterium]